MITSRIRRLFSQSQATTSDNISLVGSLGVVPINPFGDDTTKLIERLEAVLPNTFFLERANESLHQAVFLGSVRRDVFLSQSVFMNGATVQPEAEYQTDNLPIYVPGTVRESG